MLRSIELTSTCAYWTTRYRDGFRRGDRPRQGSALHRESLLAQTLRESEGESFGNGVSRCLDLVLLKASPGFW